METHWELHWVAIEEPSYGNAAGNVLEYYMETRWESCGFSLETSRNRFSWNPIGTILANTADIALGSNRDPGFLPFHCIWADYWDQTRTFAA